MIIKAAAHFILILAGIEPAGLGGGMDQTVNIEIATISELINVAVRAQLKDQPVNKVLPQRVYCEQNNITIELVKKRLQTGIWRMGAEVLEIKGAGRFIDTEATDSWARREGKSFLLV